ncbi:hypothetical protein DV515_00018901 [Chloebia gouldiae]|uniref:ARI5A protein n=1 Tax=Chloebia gouldiae TaxID=44316 RepID=A0A3L8Q682_CHLGU|nr:hypothetical protein DV515_00018901 [Chloebia gouldiae]
MPAPSPSGRCPSPCRSHSETYKRLFSSFYSKGNHPIMSPLAKKKLLAQVSKAESLHCHKRPCPEGRRAPSDAGPEPPGLRGAAPAEPWRAPDRAPSVASEAGPARSASPAGRDSQGCPQDGGAAPAVFTGYFHAYRSEGPQPAGCAPLWGYFSNLKDFLEPPSAFPARPEEPEQPPELRGHAGRPWDGRAAAVQACWVPPGATFGPAAPRAGRGRHEEEEEEEEDDDDEEEEEDEEPFGPAANPRAVSPLAKEGRDRRSRSPGGHRGLAKPKAVVATPGFTAPLPPDAFKGAALHFPGAFGSPLEHLKTRGVPVAPALSVSPVVIPAFPSPLVVASELCRPLATGAGRSPASYGSSPRLYPAAPWHGQRSCSSPHGPAFPHHARP